MAPVFHRTNTHHIRRRLIVKKTFLFLLTAVLMLLPFQPSWAWSAFRNETGHAPANVTSAETPYSQEETRLKWQIKFEPEEAVACNSSPVITEQYIYLVCKNKLYKLNKDGNILSTLTLAAPMNSICHMSLNENRLFIPLSGGMLQCVDSTSMTSLWVSEAFGMQSLTTTYYRNGYVYAGTTNASGTDGLFYCVSAADGKTQWTCQNTENPCGYYWSGAVSRETASVEEYPASDFILFGGDNGVLISHDAVSDTIYDTFDLNAILPGSVPKGKIRAGVTYDAGTNAFYTTTTNGYLYQIRMTDEGRFDSVLPVCLGAEPNPSANCTSTPTIYHGRIYVCSYDGQHGTVSVIDASTMTRIYSAGSTDCRDIKSSPLVSTGYVSDEKNGGVYVYFTQNAVPGGIYFIKDEETSVSADIQTLFLPETGKQFCLTSIAADADGTLYYSNDSGTLFAIEKGRTDSPAEPTMPAQPEPTTGITVPAGIKTPAPVLTPQQTQTNTDTAKSMTANNAKPSKQTNQKKPGKPKKIRFSVKKKNGKNYRVAFTWSKGKNTRFTLVQIKGKKKLRTSGSKKSITMKKGRYTIRFYGCQNARKKSGAVKLTLRLK